jgi:hypothetical protein
MALAMLAGQAFGQVKHGVVNCVEVSGADTAAAVTLTAVPGFGVWNVLSASSNRGDYVLDFGGSADNTSGVLMVSAYQVERTEPSVVGANSAILPYYPVSAAAKATGSVSSRYMISSFKAGSTTPGTPEVNTNATVAYFPNTDGWLAAALYNSVNNGVITSVVGNVTLRTEATFTGTGNELVDPNVATPPAGIYYLHSSTIDFRRDGVLLACGAKDENNRASWSTNYITGDAYIWCQDLAADSTSGENDPAAFVFIPEGTRGVTMGTVTATAKKLFKQGDFSVSMVGQPATDGTFRLTIAGESPSTGTMLVSPYIRPDRAGTTIDNPVWVQPDGNGWLLTTRDQPGMALQDLTNWDVAFSFAFLKNGVAITPGTPARTYRDHFGEAAAARFTVTELSGGNGNGEMDVVRSAGNSILDIAGVNRGDNQISYLGALFAAAYDNSLDAREGVMLGSVSEFVRDNTVTAGVSGWSTFSYDNGDAVSHNASITGGEINSNFATAFFPVSMGFFQNADIDMPGGHLTLNPPNLTDAVAEGVLMAINWDNNNRIIQVASNGNRYDLTSYEAQNVTYTTGGTNYLMGDTSIESVEAGYVYLPYSTPGLIAGQIAADGSTRSSTGSFTITQGTEATLGFPVFNLSISGVDARTDGVLLLNASEGAFAMAWQPGANGAFQISGLDLHTQQVGTCAFSFAYIPYQGFGVGPACGWQASNCPADFNVDGGVDGSDIGAFFTDWESGSPCADTNLDGGIDGADVETFFSAWQNGGC